MCDCSRLVNGVAWLCDGLGTGLTVRGCDCSRLVNGVAWLCDGLGTGLTVRGCGFDSQLFQCRVITRVVKLFFKPVIVLQ